MTLVENRDPVAHLFSAWDKDLEAYLKIFDRRGNTLHIHAADEAETILATTEFQRPTNIIPTCGIVRNGEDRIIAIIEQQQDDGAFIDRYTIFDANGYFLGRVQPTTRTGFDYEVHSRGGEISFIRDGRSGTLTVHPSGDTLFEAGKIGLDAAAQGAAWLSTLAS